MKKVLLISAHFPPELNVASLRPYYMAMHLVSQGCNVSVLTTANETTTKLNLDVSKLTVLRITDPISRLLRSFFLGRAKAEAVVRQSRVNPTKLNQFKSAVIRFARKYGIFCGQRFPDFYNLFHLYASRHIREKYDLVITTVPPFALLYMGHALKGNMVGSKWLIDWRDLWTNHPTAKGLPIFRKIEKLLEKRYIECADYNVFASDGMRRYIEELYSVKGLVCYNGYTGQPQQRPPRVSRTVNIVYSGTIYPGIRDPETIFKAIAMLGDAVCPNTVKFTFIGSCESVLDLSAVYGLESYVDFLGIVPYEDARRLQSNASILLYLDCKDSGQDGIIGAKLFEYLQSGIPVLCVDSPPQGEASMILKKAIGASVYQTNQLMEVASYIKYIANGGEPFYRLDEAEVAKYSRDVQLERVFSKILL